MEIVRIRIPVGDRLPSVHRDELVRPGRRVESGACDPLGRGLPAVHRSTSARLDELVRRGRRVESGACDPLGRGLPAVHPWNAVTAAVQVRYEVARRGASWLGIVWADPDGRAGLVPVRVERAELESVPQLLILADVCRASRLPLWEAMTRNLTFAFGAYAIEAERIVIRSIRPLAPDLAFSVPELIDRLAREAFRARAQLSEPPTGAAELVQVFPAD
jgi:hypothetical protein